MKKHNHSLYEKKLIINIPTDHILRLKFVKIQTKPKKRRASSKSKSTWENELETLYLGQKALSEYLQATNRYYTEIVMENSTQGFGRKY